MKGTDGATWPYDHPHQSNKSFLPKINDHISVNDRTDRNCQAGRVGQVLTAEMYR